LKGYHHERKECRHCHEQIAVGAHSRHEKQCSKLSPEERAKQTQARLWAAQRADRRPVNGAVVAAKKRGPYRRRLGILENGKGRRLYATISVDFKTLRTLILELAPSISIDKVEVL